MVMPSCREVFHHAQHFAGQLRIESRGHFVEQHHLGRHGERTRNRDTLLLSARELFRVGIGLLGQADLAEHLRRDAPRFVTAEALSRGAGRA